MLLFQREDSQIPWQKKTHQTSPYFLQRGILILFGGRNVFKRLVICGHCKRNLHFCKYKLGLNSNKTSLESARLQYWYGKVLLAPWWHYSSFTRSLWCLRKIVSEMHFLWSKYGVFWDMIEGLAIFRRFKIFSVPFGTRKRSLHGCTTWNWDLKNKQLNLDSFLPEGILWEVKATESFPDSPVLEAAQQCKEDRFYLPSSLGHQYAILQEEHNGVWVGAWEDAGETWQGSKGQQVGLGVGDLIWNSQFH